MQLLTSGKFFSRRKFSLFLCLMLLPIFSVLAHNKVVVIPLQGDDATIKPFAPLAPTSPAPSNYNIPFARPGVVIDQVTGLMWQQSDDGELRNWKEANQFCSSLVLGASVFGAPAFTDWRLPSHVELQSIVDYGETNPPVINIGVFPGTAASVYWSSNLTPGFPDTAITISFEFGFRAITFLINDFHVRCVR